MASVSLKMAVRPKHVAANYKWNM